MAKYTITWCETKKEGEKNGKPWKITSLTLKDEHGNTIDKVDTFDPVMNGETVEGEITESQYGKNFKKMTPKAVAGANFKTQQMEKVIERKEQSITKFQDSKEQSIKLASSMSGAINLAIAEQNPSPENVIKWRKWILNSWDIDPTDLNAF